MIKLFQCRQLIVLSLLFTYISFPDAVFPQKRLSLSKPLLKRWFYQSEYMSNLTPTVNGEIVFLPLLNGKIVALGKQSGDLSWISELGGEFSASPISDDSRVYIASEVSSESKSTEINPSGALHCLGTKSGLTLWARRLSAPIRTTLITNNDALFAGTVDGKLYSIKKTTGQISWIKNNPSPFYSQPVLTDDKLLIGDEAGQIIAIEQDSGRTAWRYRTRGALRASPAVMSGFIFAGSSDSSVYSISEKTGKLGWRARTSASIQTLIATPGCIIATSLDNFVYCLSPKSGRKIWKRRLAGRILSRPLATHDGVLFAPLAGDECIVLDLKDGKTINSVDVGDDNNTAAAPIQADNILLISTRKGLIAFSGELE